MEIASASNPATFAGSPAAPRVALPMGLIAVLATVTMLFTAFTSSYLVRRTSGDWVRVSVPDTAWGNTLFLMVASAALEGARRSGPASRGSRWLAVSAVGGVGFLAAQVWLWHQLAERGVFLQTGPHASFIYMLTGVHALHLAGGLAALVYAGLRPRATGACAAYWHLLAAVWVWVLLLLTQF